MRIPLAGSKHSRHQASVRLKQLAADWNLRFINMGSISSLSIFIVLARTLSGRRPSVVGPVADRGKEPFGPYIRKYFVALAANLHDSIRQVVFDLMHY